MKKKRMAALCLAAAIGLSSCSGVNTGFGQEQITFFRVPGWEDTNGVSLLWVELLAERDISMELMTVDMAAGFASMSKGDIDGHLNTWLPVGHSTYVDEYRDDLVVLDEHGGLYENNKFSIVVPEYSDAETIDDVVDNPADYNSEIIGIEAGSGLMTALPETLGAYDATSDFDVVAGSTPAMLASLERAIDRNEDIAVTLWRPHWAFDSLPLKELEDPKGGWPEADTSYVVVSEEFAEEHPQIAEWMSKMSLTDEQYASLMYEVGHTDDPQQGARNWLEVPENRATADSWFE